MASHLRLKFLLNLPKVWNPLLSVQRGVHPGHPEWHLNPIQSREEIALLESEGKLEAMKVIPVKPAPTSMTNSLFDDQTFNKFTNIVMKWSQKTLARDLMFETFARIKRIQLKKYHKASADEKEGIELDPRVIFKQAIENCKPVLSVTPIKKGGITYQVPVPVSSNHARFMSMKWLVMAGRDKSRVAFIETMSKELLDAFNNEGKVIKRKQDLHKLCETNKAYAHYRWS